MQYNSSPYLAHVFICTNDRKGVRKSCADTQSELVKAKVKEIVHNRGWKGTVRISTSGCMGLCAEGANVIIYPQKIWLSEVSLDDVDEIIAVLETIVSAS